MENTKEIPDCISALNNSCTLVAVKEVTRKPDAEIIQAFLAHGYKPHKGMVHHKWTAAARDLGMELEEVSTKAETGDAYDDGSYWTKRMTLGEFVKKNSTGTYFVSVLGHALVVREGKVVDKGRNNLGLRRKVKFAKLVKNAPPVEVAPSTGGLKPVIAPIHAKRYGTASYLRYKSMYEFVTSYNGYPKAEEVLKNTQYTAADLTHDLKKGLVEYV